MYISYIQKKKKILFTCNVCFWIGNKSILYHIKYHIVNLLSVFRLLLDIRKNMSLVEVGFIIEYYRNQFIFKLYYTFNNV